MQLYSCARFCEWFNIRMSIKDHYFVCMLYLSSLLLCIVYENKDHWLILRTITLCVWLNRQCLQLWVCFGFVCGWICPGKAVVYRIQRFVRPSVRNSLLVGMAVPLGHIIRISENSLCSHRHELKRVKYV
jgi:hypothetical protein